MECKVYWIDKPDDPRLGIMPRPRGGNRLEHEIASLKRQGVDVLVSLLTEDEVDELELQEEAAWCEEKGIEFISFPIPDRGVPPDDNAFRHFLQTLLDRLADGKSVAIHCFAGIGRSGLVAAGVLIAQGLAWKEAVRAISLARQWPIPDTEEQLIWVSEFAEAYSKGKQ